MSVLIEGLKMPENCMECINYGLRTAIRCAEWTEISAGSRQHTRSLCCPLIEVPTPHGDLIDRNVALDSLMVEMVGTGYQSKAMRACDEYFVPAVIEEEE